MKYLLALVLLLSSCQMETPDSENSSEPLPHQDSSPDKKIVMVMIDSLMSSSLDQSLTDGKVPGLQYLIDNGRYEKNLIAPFPSMSVTVESTLITGEMPDVHHIPGLSWYKENEDRLVNYGSNWIFWWKNGLSQSMIDALYNLNNLHLNKETTTIFEEVGDLGLSSGAINTVLYRGNHEHQLNMLPMTSMFTDVPQTMTVKGPDTLAFGRLKKPDGLEKEQFSDSLFKRAGLRDKYSMEAVQKLVAKKKQPDFLLIFFPDNDKETHKHGPDYRAGLEKADQYLQGILDSYGSWERALDKNIFIIFGDHGQDELLEDEEKSVIDLETVLNDFHSAPLGESVRDGEVAFGVNQRMAYIYDVQNNDLLYSMAMKLMEDSRIDIMAWLEKDWVKVMSPDHEGELCFKEGGEWRDQYGKNWTLEGNTDILDLKQSDDDYQVVDFHDYPDVLNHLETALKSHATPKIIAAAKPGHSFRAEGIATNEGGGDHGGLHKNDLLTAMITTGTDKQPDFSRIADLKKFVLQLLKNDEQG